MVPLSSMPSALRSSVLQSFTQTDNVCTHLSRVLSTATGTDKFLVTIYYTIKLLYPQVSRLRSLRARHLLTSFVTKASSTLLPGEAIITTLDSFRPDDDALGTLEASMRALADTISEVRIFVRCWGLLGIYSWGRSTYLDPPKDAVTKIIVWNQIGVNVGFQWYETAAYLASKGVLRGERFGTKTQDKWWIWSSRFWTAHIVLEAARLLRSLQLHRETEEDGKRLDELVKAKKLEDSQAWRRTWIVNAAYAPIALHYGLEDGLLSDEWLGVMGVIAGTIGFTQVWKSAS